MGLLYFPKTKKAQSRSKFRAGRFRHCILVASVLIAGFLFFQPETLSGQVPLPEKTITIPRQNTTLYKALNLISNQAECLFIYESKTVESDKRVRLIADQEPLHKVLGNLLVNTGLTYRILGKHILIYRAKGEDPPPDAMEPALPADTLKNVVISGRICDNQSKAAIPFATIGIAEEHLGTVTNNDGFFTLKIPASLIGTSLVVSHLGYTSQYIPVRLISEQQVDLYLDRRVISIQEVIIRYIDPNLIMEKALEQRRMNYADEPVYLTAFYREGVQRNNSYTSYSEAVFRVYKSPVDEGDRADQVKLLKSRKVQDSNCPDTVFLKLKAGVQSALLLDIVKCIPGFLDQMPPAEYTYKYSNLVSYNARDAYAIGFTKKAGENNALYCGTLYIAKEGFAILGADFEINPTCLDKAAEELVLKKSSGLIVKLKKISYSVSYMPFNGRYYLSHVRCDLEVATRLRHHLSSDHFKTFLELATCKIDTADVVKFPKQETMKPGVVFSDQPYRNNDAFWGDFNIIPPEASLREALGKIIGKIEEVE